MDYYMIAGMVLFVLIAISGFYFSIKNNFEKDEKRRTEELRALNELNLNIVKLSTNIENMKAGDLIRDKRIEKHGEEIDDLNEMFNVHEKKLTDHESRLKCLEKK